MDRKVIGHTKSLCPECFITIDAQKVKIENDVYLEKKCPDHGNYQTLIWRGMPEYESWSPCCCGEDIPKMVNPKPFDKGCPYDCGICENHKQITCCVLFDVTQRCNLRCPVCFAQATETGNDVSIKTIEEWFQKLLTKGGPFNIQLSGGEPTLRDDLPDVIKLGKKIGFDFFQLNTNGIRLAEDKAYIEQLANAGLNCVFLQFDSLKDETLLKIRGRKLIELKQKAIENCKEFGIGVVLVPTLIKNINTDEIGELIQYAIENMPTVRGIHFQPISFFGRYTSDFLEQVHTTLPEVLTEIDNQTEGLLKVSDFTGGNAENAYCSFHGTYRKKNETLILLKSVSGCCGSSKQAKEHVATHWSGQNGDYTEQDGFDTFLNQLHLSTFTVSGMLFQDAWNIDLERLQKCYIHVMTEKGLIPFCAYHLTNEKGQHLYEK